MRGGSSIVGDDVLAYTNLWEWDRWLWDIRQCFRGARDPQDQFVRDGDYWQWSAGEGNPNPYVAKRPLFTMGKKATVSFGIVIAHHSVPLAIALENLWDAEKAAKDHFCANAGQKKKDAVQVRVLYANGNILRATSKFNTFHQWQLLLP
jgi:CRISPR-associated protein Cmr2